MLNDLLKNVENLINNNVIFITGGTGTFGHEITKVILEKIINLKINYIFQR